MIKFEKKFNKLRRLFWKTSLWKVN